MHRLLMERGDIIDRPDQGQAHLGSALGVPPGARGPTLMRRPGAAPTAASSRSTPRKAFWRVIIATFTYVAGGRSGCMPTWRPAKPRCATPSVSISASRCRSSPIRGGRRVAAVAASQGDLGLVPVTRRRRRLVERARGRRRAEDHRAAALRRARRSPRRFFRSSRSRDRHPDCGRNRRPPCGA